MASALDVKRRHERELLATPGVVGVALGERNGCACILVYVSADAASLRDALPRSLDDIPVEIEETGPFQARTRR